MFEKSSCCGLFYSDSSAWTGNATVNFEEEGQTRYEYRSQLCTIVLYSIGHIIFVFVMSNSTIEELAANLTEHKEEGGTGSKLFHC